MAGFASKLQDMIARNVESVIDAATSPAKKIANLQREIEEAVRAAREAGDLPAGPVTARMVLKIEAVGLEHEVTGEIDMPGDA